MTGKVHPDDLELCLEKFHKDGGLPLVSECSNALFGRMFGADLRTGTGDFFQPREYGVRPYERKLCAPDFRKVNRSALDVGKRLLVK